MVSADEKKRAKLAELGFNTEAQPELTSILLKNWTATTQVLKSKHSKQLVDCLILEFFSRGWIKTGSDLKKSAEVGSFLISIAQKHFGDRPYEPKEVFNLEFLSFVVKDFSEWKSLISILSQSESPFDLFQNGLKSLFQNKIISTSKDLDLIKKISKSAGHNANNIFSFGIPVLTKYRVVSSAKDLEKLTKALLDICNSVKYPENVLRDLAPFGEKNILRDKKDLEIIRDILKTEKDEWKSQQKFYQILNLVNMGKIKFSVDLKKYTSKSILSLEKKGYSTQRN